MCTFFAIFVTYRYQYVHKIYTFRLQIAHKPSETLQSFFKTLQFQPVKSKLVSNQLTSGSKSFSMLCPLITFKTVKTHVAALMGQRSKHCVVMATSGRTDGNGMFVIFATIIHIATHCFGIMYYNKIYFFGQRKLPFCKWV